MHTGTLIRDLLAMVERAERRSCDKELAEERELRVLFESQIVTFRHELALVGAA